MGRETGSWLSGASAALPEGAHSEYRGAGLGLPRDGVGSLAPTGRRILGLLFDWVPCGVIAFAIVGQSPNQGLLTAGLWLGIGILTVTMFGFTPGQYFAGLRVARIEGAAVRVGFVRALGRGLLILFMVPPLIQDVDGRGMQDRATGTIVVRTR